MRSNIVILVFIFLVSCLPAPTHASIPTPELEKWMKYERALALEILKTIDARCEWMIHGQANREVYVWAICKLINSTGWADSASVPAVIYLGQDGNIEKVLIPDDGEEFTHYGSKYLPLEIQDKLLNQSGSDIDAMWAHIFSRAEKPEPPLIVSKWEVPLP
jgi:hypothetical protein